MSASGLADVLARAAALGAYRGCDAHERNHGITYRAVMEWTGPAAVAALAKAAAAAGAIHGPTDPLEKAAGCVIEKHYAALDLLDADGDVIGDWCIPDRAGWDWMVRAIELRAVASDCPVDEPAAYAVLAPYRIGLAR